MCRAKQGMILFGMLISLSIIYLRQTGLWNEQGIPIIRPYFTHIQSLLSPPLVVCIYIYIYTYIWYKHACYTMNRHLHIFTISVESCIKYVTYDTCLMHLCTCNELGCSPNIYSQNINTYWYFTPFARNALAQVIEIILMEGMELHNLYIVDKMRANGLLTERAWDQRPRYWQCGRNNSVRIYGNSRIICFMITTGGKRVNDSY